MSIMNMLIYRAWPYSSKEEECQQEEQTPQELELENEDEEDDKEPIEVDGDEEEEEDKEAPTPKVKSLEVDPESKIYRNVDHDKKLYQVWYNSLEEVTSEKMHKVNKFFGDPMTENNYSQRWTGCNSREELDNMLRSGWPEGVKKAEELGGSLQVPRLRNIRRLKKRSDFGDHVDMQMIYSGQLDIAWQKSQRENSPNKTGNAITLLVNIDENCSVSAEEMFWSGAVAIRLIDMLIQTGRNIRILAFQKGRRTYENNYGQESIYVVKEYTEQLDIGKLMVILGLAGFFRKYGFVSILSAPYKVNYGLGCADHSGIPHLLADREPLANIIYVKKAYDKEDAERLLTEFATNLEESIINLTKDNEVETY